MAIEHHEVIAIEVLPHGMVRRMVHDTCACSDGVCHAGGVVCGFEGDMAIAVGVLRAGTCRWVTELPKLQCDVEALEPGGNHPSLMELQYIVEARMGANTRAPVGCGVRDMPIKRCEPIDVLCDHGHMCHPWWGCGRGIGHAFDFDNIATRHARIQIPMTGPQIDGVRQWCKAVLT